MQSKILENIRMFSNQILLKNYYYITVNDMFTNLSKKKKKKGTNFWKQQLLFICFNQKFNIIFLQYCKDLRAKHCYQTHFPYLTFLHFINGSMIQVSILSWHLHSHINMIISFHFIIDSMKSLVIDNSSLA